jgi:hypothetical protein
MARIFHCGSTTHFRSGIKVSKRTLKFKVLLQKNTQSGFGNPQKGSDNKKISSEPAQLEGSEDTIILVQKCKRSDYFAALVG